MQPLAHAGLRELLLQKLELGSVVCVAPKFKKTSSSQPLTLHWLLLLLLCLLPDSAAAVVTSPCGGCRDVLARHTGQDRELLDSAVQPAGAV